MNRAGKRAWWRRARKRRDADERQRYLIIAYLADGARSPAVAQRLGRARATVVWVVRYEDEVEIHLNPNLGYDWMLRSQQKVVTPGTNVKRYRTGALNPETGRVIWVRGERKVRALFLTLLD
jgi:hypothetical protein